MSGFTTVAKTAAKKVSGFTTVAKTVAKKTIGLAHTHFAPCSDSYCLARTAAAACDVSYALTHAARPSSRRSVGAGWRGRGLYRDRRGALARGVYRGRRVAACGPGGAGLPPSRVTSSARSRNVPWASSRSMRPGRRGALPPTGDALSTLEECIAGVVSQHAARAARGSLSLSVRICLSCAELVPRSRPEVASDLLITPRQQH